MWFFIVFLTIITSIAHLAIAENFFNRQPDYLETVMLFTLLLLFFYTIFKNEGDKNDD